MYEWIEGQDWSELVWVAGWLGATAALVGHGSSPSLALCFGSGEAMKRLT